MRGPDLLPPPPGEGRGGGISASHTIFLKAGAANSWFAQTVTGR